jgi:hypothetical protein
MKIADYLEAKFKRLKDEAAAQKRLETFETKKAEKHKEIKKAGDQLDKVLKEKMLFRNTNASRLIHNSILAFKQTYKVNGDEAKDSPLKERKAVQFRSMTPTRQSESQVQRKTSASIDIDTYFELYEQKGIEVQRQIMDIHRKKNDTLANHQNKIAVNKAKAVEAQDKRLDEIATRYIRKILDFDSRKSVKEKQCFQEIEKQKEKVKENKGAMHEKLQMLKSEMDQTRKQIAEVRREKVERVLANKEVAMRQTLQKLHQFKIKHENHFMRSTEINESNVI